MGDARIIIAGFRDLSEELNFHGTPLQFCHRLRLHNLASDQAKAMLREPMSNLGVRLQRDVYPKILKDTGGHPQLIQRYGQTLIEILDKTGERVINMSHIRQIKQRGDLYDALIEPLIDNTNALELSIVYSLSQHDEFSIEDIDCILNSHGLKLSTKRIHQVCRTLFNIGMIIRKGNANRYQFSIPLLPELAHQLADEEFIWRKARQFLDSNISYEE
jgi:hypothetical protein